MSAAIEQAREAFAAIPAAEAALRTERVKRDQLAEDLADAKGEREKLTSLEDRDAATRIIDGDTAAPVRPQRSKKLATLNERIPALAAAIPLQDTRIAHHSTALAALRQPLNDAVVALVNDVQAPAVEAARLALSAMAPECAKLIAVDIVRERIAGSKMVLTAGQTPPFSGAIAVRKMLTALPDRFRPDALDQAKLNADAEQIAAEIIAQIRGNGQ